MGLIIALLLLSVGCAPDRPDLAALDDAGFIAHLDRRIPALMQGYDIPGVGMLLVRERQVIWSGAFGYADREQQRPLTVETLMMTHSISKSVTAWGVLRLVEDGTITLDDPVRRHLRADRFPAVAALDDGVTIGRLLSHGAGLPLGRLGVHYRPGEDIPPLAESLTAGELGLLHTPGAMFSYSNTGYAVLEALIEQLTGRDFGEYMEAEVLRPLGMRAAGFDRGGERLAAVPTGYDVHGRAVPVYLYPFRASGGMFATLEDLGRFVIAGLGAQAAAPANPVLSPAGIARLHELQLPLSGVYRLVSDAYGYGHFVETLDDGHSAIWHGGQGLGWMTHYHAVPETGDGIVILTNSQRSWPFIAMILNDWARWRGFVAPGMGRLATAETVMKFLVGAIVAVSVWRAVAIGAGIAAGRRRMSLSLEEATARRLIEFAAGIILLLALLWSLGQEYLFVTSAFPLTSTWLGTSLFLLALVLLASALFATGSDHNKLLIRR